MNLPISIIVAMTKQGVIGITGNLPWKISEELQYFKRTTLNKAIIMGSTTFVSINCKPLPKRHNIVLTRDPEKFILNHNVVVNNYDNLSFVSSVEDSLKSAKEVYISGKVTLPEIMVIGGKEIYKQFLLFTNKLYRSIIKQNYSGDVYFPPLNLSKWNLISSEDYAEFVAQVLVKS